MIRRCRECDKIITSAEWWKAIFCSRTCFSKNRIGKKIHSDESLKKISDRSKMSWSNPEYRQKMSDAHKGQTAWNKGKKTPRKVIKKLRESHLGKVMSDVTKQRMSESHKGLNVGQKNGSWNNGSSFLPYSIEWTSSLRESIRKRDGYNCMICHSKTPGPSKSFHVHHINYDKKNCKPENLITLCHICHMKTHHNRNYWRKYFANLIK